MTHERRRGAVPALSLDTSQTVVSERGGAGRQPRVKFRQHRLQPRDGRFGGCLAHFGQFRRAGEVGKVEPGRGRLDQQVDRPGADRVELVELGLEIRTRVAINPGRFMRWVGIPG